MRHFAGFVIALAICATGSANAQTVVERLDPALDALVAPDTKVEKLVEDADAFFEGPVWHHGREGNFLTFSDLVRNRVDRLDSRTHHCGGRGRRPRVADVNSDSPCQADAGREQEDLLRNAGAHGLRPFSQPSPLRNVIF